MSAAVTVGQITGSVRLRGDYQLDSTDDYADAFASAAAVVDAVNSSYRRCYELMVDADPDRFVSTYTVSTTGSTESYALPDDLFRLRSVGLLLNGTGDELPLARLGTGERSLFKTYGTAVSTGTPQAYRLEGSTIVLAPVPSGGDTLRITYTRVAARLSSSLQSVDMVHGFEDLVVWEAVRDLRVRERKETLDADAAIVRETARVERMSRNRDRAGPRRLRDPLAGGGYFYRGPRWR